MDIKVQKDILKVFSSGKLHDVYETENKIVLIIDMSEFKQFYHSSYFKCELIKCKEFGLKINGDYIKDFDKIKQFKIEIEDTEVINRKLNVNCSINKRTIAIFNIDTESIKVYDELDRKISLFDLSILDGLCTSGVGIEFYIKGSHSKGHVKFKEELHDYLCHKEQYWKRYKENGPKEKFDLLLGWINTEIKFFQFKKLFN